MMSRVNFKELNENTFDVAIDQILQQPSGYAAQSKQFEEIDKWCKDNNIKAIVGVMYATFRNKEDQFAFKMRWC